MYRINIEGQTESRRKSILMKILLVILCFILPPLAVYLKTKDVKSTLINLVLCFLGGIPGIIHGLWVVLKG